MKNFVCVILILFLGLSLSSNVYSQEKEKKETKKETMKEMSKDKDSSKTMAGGKAFNTICPVSSEDIDSEITYTYNGKTYAFCCNKCLKKFKADPEKYSSKLNDDGKSMKEKN